MKLMVAIYDRAVETYGPIMQVNTRGEAVRSLRDAMDDPNSAIKRHPTDYELWQIGQYDETTGVTTSNLEKIARAEDLQS